MPESSRRDVMQFGLSAALVSALPDVSFAKSRADTGNTPAAFAKVAEMIKTGLEQKKIPSVSIAISQKGRAIWEQSFGWADREKQIKATPHTVYSLASITKSMTATALMTLVRKGKIVLDAPAERYIGSGMLTAYAGSANDVTVRRLLHHTAGLPQHFNYFYADEPGQPHSMEETIRHFGIIVDVPGKTFRYANLGYGILGHIIANVSGHPLAEYIQTEVFQPLGMNDTVFDPGPGQAIAMRYDTNRKAVPFMRCDTPGAAHAYASVQDLLRFGMFHLKDRLADQRPILEASTIDQMHTEQDGTAHDGREGEESYGLGWFIGPSPNGLATVWHEGGWTGASSMLKLVPARDIAVAVAMNTFDHEFTEQLTENALRAVIADFGTARPAAQLPSPPPFVIPAGTYTGEVRIPGGNIPIVLDSTGTEVHVRLGDLSSPPKTAFILPVTRRPGEFLGSIPGPIGDTAFERFSDSALLDLRTIGGELKGTISASTWPDEPRMHFLLSYAVSLKRES